MGGGGGAEKTEDQRARAHRDGDAPVDAAAALKEPGRQQPGEEEGEERGGRRLVDAKAAEERQESDHQHPADADGADQEADERGNYSKDESGDQPAAKATSSLVSSTASFFSSA